MQAVDFKDLAGSSKLFLDFINHRGPAKEYYKRDFRQPESYRQVIHEIDITLYDRKRLATILTNAVSSLDVSPQTKENIDKLSQPDSLCVFAGQQVGMLLGPNYTILKALTAYKLAIKLEAELGRPVVPCFWLASDDHDFEEIKTVHFLDRAGDCHGIFYEPANSPDALPMSDLFFDSHIEEFIFSVENLLLGTEFSGEIKKWIRDAYRQDQSVSVSFARLFNTVLPEFGIIPVDPNYTGMKEMFIPLFTREINGHQEIFDLFESQSRRITNAGYHLQVEKSADLMNLFITKDGARRNIIAKGDMFSIDSKESMPRTELMQLLENEPMRFSANVMLRPIAQCLAFPTVAQIVGPSEAAYFAQIEPMYHYHGVAWPVIRPRIFATLLEPHIKKSFQKFSIDFAKLYNDPDREITRIVTAQYPPEFQKKAEMLRALIERPLHELAMSAEKIDKESADALEYTRKRIDHELNHLSKKLLMAHKKRHENIVNQARRTAAFLFPMGKFQERVLSPLYFMNKYGLDIFSDLDLKLDIDCTGHQLIEVRK
jgi:bacillithiol biosynthesis cysteine-adding enzyme BshC